MQGFYCNYQTFDIADAKWYELNNGELWGSSTVGGSKIWSSGTNGPVKNVTVNDNGFFTMYSPNENVIWTQDMEGLILIVLCFCCNLSK